MMTLWTPADITTALWLDAADSTTLFDATTGGSAVAVDDAVARWEDKSGNERHATQATLANRPIRLSDNSLRFDGSDFITVSATAIARNVASSSIFCVRKWRSLPPSGKIIVSVFVNGSQAAARIALLGGSPASKSYAGGRRLDTDGFSPHAASADISAGFETHSVEIDYQNRNLKQYVDGLVDGQSSAFQTSGNTSNTDAGGVGIGASLTGSISSDIDVQEIIIIDGALAVDATNRQRVEGYLAHKWGIAGSLPAGHPYKDAAPPASMIQTRRRRDLGGFGL